MKRSELARLLTMAKSLDDRVSVDEARVYAWELALAPDLPFEIAVQALGKHYSASDKAVMPVYLNDFWKAYKRSEAEKRASIAISDGKKSGVPPTQEWKDALEAIKKGVKQRNGTEQS